MKRKVKTLEIQKRDWVNSLWYASNIIIKQIMDTANKGMKEAGDMERNATKARNRDSDTAAVS